MNPQEWNAHCAYVARANARSSRQRKRPKDGLTKKQMREAWEQFDTTLSTACAEFEALPSLVREALDAQTEGDFAIMNTPGFLGDRLGQQILRCEQVTLWKNLRIGVQGYLCKLAYRRLLVGDYSLTGIRHFRLPFDHHARGICRAKNRRGVECRMLSVPGRKRCRFHGGFTPPKHNAFDELTCEVEERLEQNPHDLEAFAILNVLALSGPPALAPWEWEKAVRRKTRQSAMAE